MKRSAGYSLFEVLLAFSILAMVLATLLPGQAALLRRATDGPSQVLAHDYALSKLASLGVDAPLLAGETQTIYRGWKVEISVSDTSANNISVMHIAITISTVRDDRILASVESWRPVQ